LVGLHTCRLPVSYWNSDINRACKTVPSWLPMRVSRFTLRTLLIATTLVAVVLGLAVWLR
jgi:hypothetical protein